jgi:phospholipase/carboxylesterase
VWQIAFDVLGSVEGPGVRTIPFALLTLVAAGLLAGCTDARRDAGAGRGEHAQGRLWARPGEETARACRGGISRIGAPTGRPTLFYVPRAAASRRVPLVVSLHGAGGGAENGLGLLRPLADDLGFAVLAPASTGPTWDVVRGSFGTDVARIDRALDWIFRRCPVDRDRIAVAGFSDGASYALSLGLANGDLFRHVIAFSPGFVAPTPARGMPAVFISHGTRDSVLPIEQTSRRIVPALRRAGYDVRYRELDAGHAASPALVRAAIRRAVTR